MTIKTTTTIAMPAKMTKTRASKAMSERPLHLSRYGTDAVAFIHDDILARHGVAVAVEDDTRTFIVEAGTGRAVVITPAPVAVSPRNAPVVARVLEEYPLPLHLGVAEFVTRDLFDVVDSLVFAFIGFGSPRTGQEADGDNAECAQGTGNGWCFHSLVW